MIRNAHAPKPIISFWKGRFVYTLKRLSWWFVWTLALITLIVAVPTGYQRLMTPCAGPECATDQVLPENVDSMLAMGISLQAYALFNIAIALVVAIVFASIATIIFWRRHDDGIAWYMSITMIIVGVFITEFIDAARLMGPGWGWMLDIMSSLAWIMLGTLLYVFPDGHFVPSWAWVFAVAWMMTQLPYYLAHFWQANWLVVINPGDWPMEVQAFYFASLFVAGILIQVYRYRHVSSPTQRLQTKWVIFGLVVAVFAIIGLNLLPEAIAPYLMEDGSWSQFLIDALSALAFLLIPTTIAMAVLRYRLWDIDIIIRKTLVYGLLTVLLASVYFGSIVFMQALVSHLTSVQSPVVIVLSTLLISVLFSPMRRRIQDLINRRFYRKKYDSQQVLSEFAGSAKNETDLESLLSALVEVLGETIQPELVKVWLKKDGDRSS